MAKKLSEKVNELKLAHAEAAIEEIEKVRSGEALVEFGMLIGASASLKAVADTASIKSIRALQAIRDSKLYQHFGYSRFDQFLDKDPRSPMSYGQFNEREKLLSLEGEVAFQTLNEMGVPLSARKLIGGKVEITEDAIVVGEGDQAQTIPLDDRPRVRAAFRAYADKTAEQQRTIERGKKDVEKWKRKAAEAEQAAPRVLDSSPHDQALNIAIVALGGLKLEAEGLSLAEAIRVRDNSMRMLTTLFSDIRAAYRFGEEAGGDLARPDVSDDELDEMFN